MPGIRYGLEYKARLGDPAWMPAGPDFTGSGASAQEITATPPPGEPAGPSGFYRAVIKP